MSFAVLSGWVLALVIAQAVRRGRSWTGTDGVGLQDQMQYLAWIEDSSRHVFASNLFVLSPTAHDYFQPLVVVSGMLNAAGIPGWLALLIWKPVAVVGVFLVVRAYVRESLVEGASRFAALVLAIFFIGPGQVIARALDHLHFFRGWDFPWHDVTLDPWIGWWSWGYPFGLIGLAAMIGALLLYSRERDQQRTVGISPFLGALASWLHPWQGATLVVILIGSELGAAARREPRRLRQLFFTTAASVLPLVYYGVLARADPSWKLGQVASQGSWPLWALAVCELPLVLPAAFAYGSRPLSFLDRATRVWPIAALAIFVCLDRTSDGFALHAFLGVNVALAVLAVQGCEALARSVPPLRRPALAWIALAALVVPALVVQLRWTAQVVSSSAQAPSPRGQRDAKFIDRGERRALDFLERASGEGGVLTRTYLGTVVPGMTGRRTYVGNAYWSPDFLSRVAATDDLFLGRMSPQTARDFVRSTEARFVLADCSSRGDLGLALRPFVAAAHRFGCARVYVLK